MKSKNSKIIYLLQKYWPFFGYLLISLILLFPILIQSGVPFKYDWSWPLFSMSQFWHQVFDFDNFGLLTIANKYLELFFGLSSIIHLSPSISIKLFLLAIHTLAGFGFYQFLRHRGVSKFVSFIAGIAYAFSPYIFIRTIVGFTTSLVAYAILPFFVDRFVNIEKKKIIDFVILGFFITFIFCQIQAGILVSIFLTFWFLLPQADIKYFSKLGRIFFMIFVATVINLPWIIIYLFARSQNSLPQASSVTTLNFIASLPHSLARTLMLSDHHITYIFFNVLDKMPFIFVSFGIVYLLAVFSLFDQKNRQLVLSIIIPTVLILPFSIGPTSIFTGIYIFVYNHFSPLAVFRETYHFEFWLSFALIPAFAFGLNWLFVKVKNNLWISVIRVISVFLVLAIIAQYFSFNYFQRFSLQQIPEQYGQLNNFLKTSGSCKKIYYPPSLGFIYFKDDPTADAANTDLIAKLIGVPYITDAALVLSFENSEIYLRNQLTSHFLDTSDNGEFAEIFAASSADCLIVRNDLLSNFYLDAKINLETNYAIRQKWIGETDMLALAKSKKNLELIKQFGDNIYIFKNSKSENQNSNEFKNSKIETIQQNDGSQALPLADWANEHNYYHDGWIRGRYAFWRKEIFADLLQDFIYTTKDGAILSHQSDQNLSGELLIRYLDGGNAGEVGIKIQDSEYRIQKNPGEEKFVVKDLGNVSVKKGEIISTKNISGENAIADLIIK